jgi:hypothetical protein
MPELRALIVFLVSLVAAAPAEAAETRELRFRVLLEDREIGYHHFALSQLGNSALEVNSEARFAVRVLFFDAYRYAHDATEVWSEGCLARLSARTVDNGERLRVSGERDDGVFSVRHPEGESELPGCVRSFAYWNPALLDQQRLLNVQTGEYVAVGVEPLGEEIIRVRDAETTAQRYSLRAPEFQVDLWYSAQGEWLALESVVAGGRRLRYELI